MKPFAHVAHRTHAPDRHQMRPLFNTFIEDFVRRPPDIQQRHGDPVTTVAGDANFTGAMLPPRSSVNPVVSLVRVGFEGAGLHEVGLLEDHYVYDVVAIGVD